MKLPANFQSVLSPQPIEFFQLLFRENEQTAFGIKSKIGTAWAENLLFPSAGEAVSSIDRQFFCINPLHPTVDFDHEKKPWYARNVPRRADLNVTAFRNFLFEMDGPDLETQENLIRKFHEQISFSAITYSGGKSYHCILSLSTDLAFEPHKKLSLAKYKNIWSALADRLNDIAGEKVIDPSCKNPSRLSRTPGQMRQREGGEDAGHTQILPFQKLIYLGNMFPTSRIENEFQNQIDSQSISPEFEGINHNLKTTEQLARSLPAALRMQFEYSYLWAGSENMYPELYRLIMWALDEAAPPFGLMKQFLKETTYPSILAAGYPSNKIDKAIEDAYTEKGVK